MKKIIAAFDFDGTITTRDTLLPFLFHTSTCYNSMLNSLKLLPTLVKYKMGLLENHAAKEQTLTTFLHGYPLEKLQHLALSFSQQRLPQYVRSAALDRIQWHQQQSHQCILVSAGLEIYLYPWAKALKFDQVIATQLQIDNQHVTGKIAGKNCFGQEKVDRLLQLVGEKENFILYAYGDSRGDRELLALADYSFYRQMPV